MAAGKTTCKEVMRKDFTQERIKVLHAAKNLGRMDSDRRKYM